MAMRKKAKQSPVGEMPEMAADSMKQSPPKGEGMMMQPKKGGKDMVEVSAHKRHKAGTTQGHPAKQRQPTEMRYLER